MPDDLDGLIPHPSLPEKGDLVASPPAGYLGLDEVQPAARKLENGVF